MGSVKIITIYVAMLVVAMALVFGAIALFDYGLARMAPIDRSSNCGYLDFAFTVRCASQVGCRSKSKTT